jgi:hypothetical protein
MEGQEKKEGEMVIISQEQNVSLAKFDPQKEIEFATKASKALLSIFENNLKKPVMINNEKYLEFEDWQTIARFFNTTVGTEKTEKLTDPSGKFLGYSATSVVYNNLGNKIGGAEASCLVDEKNWLSKPEFQLKSMAQTRACSKALRNIFGWVVVLAGFKATPAEELNDRDYSNGFGEEPFPSGKKPVGPVKPKTIVKYICNDCGKTITPKIAEYSEKNFNGMKLCMDCQKKYKK